MSEQKRSGCKGCLIWLLCLFALLVVMCGVGLYLGHRMLVSFRDQYTQAKPLALPVTSYSQADLDAVQKRIAQFIATARGNQTNAELSLSASDLNVLIASSVFSNRVYVTFTNKSLVGQVTIPAESLVGFLSKFGITALRGRYLNGASVFAVGRVNGQLSVNVKEISVNGLPLPEHYMKGIRDMNFVPGLETNAATQGAFQHISRVGIENDRLVLEVGGTNSVP